MTEPGGSGEPPAIVRRIILALIAVLTVWAVLVSLTGGLRLRPYGIPLQSTDPDRPALAALLLALLYAGAFGAHARAHLVSFDARIRPALRLAARRAPYAAAGLALATFALAMGCGVHVAGGADSYGYVSQAEHWLAGDLVVEQPIGAEVPWPNGDWTFSPLGYRPALEPGAIVPTYAPGLPILMAIATVIAGACGPYLVVPLLGGVGVWLTYRLGTRIWSSLAGLFAAALLATSPAFLVMLMQPMSDVPVSALLLAGCVAALSESRARAFWTGVMVSIAILVRPNLALLGPVFLAFVVARAPEGRRWLAVAAFGVGALPFALAVSAIHTLLYGAPWNTGYGGLEELYRWEYALPNIRQYTGWLLQVETAFVLVALAPLILIRRLDRERRIALIFLAVVSMVVWLCYLFYQPFEEWWYLRFLLPAFPPMMVMAAIGLALALRRLPRTAAAAVGLAIVAALFAVRLQTIREYNLLDLREGGVAYLSAAAYVRDRLPSNAVVMTVQHSGTIRHYGERLTMRWDLLVPEWWPRVLATLVERGYRPYLLVSTFEEAHLRERFGWGAAVDAPGRVIAAMDVPEGVRIYDPLREGSAAADPIPLLVPCPCGSAAPAGP